MAAVVERFRHERVVRGGRRCDEDRVRGGASQSVIQAPEGGVSELRMRVHRPDQFDPGRGLAHLDPRPAANPESDEYYPDVSSIWHAR